MDMTTTDLLDYIIDNRKAGRREIYRNGRLVATCHWSCSAPLLRYFEATDPFGTYPDVQPELTADYPVDAHPAEVPADQARAA